MFDNPILLAVPLVSLVTGYLGGKRVLGVLTGVLGFALAYVTTYMTLPTLALDFYDLPTLFLLASLPGILASVLRLFLNENHMGEDIRPNPLPSVAVFVLSVLFLGGQGYSTLGFRNPDAYRNIIEVTERPLDHTVELIDQTHARVIDQDLAKRRALELLGTEVGLGSSYDVGTPTVQQVNGRQVWVAPLEPAGFWVWWSGKPSPGYVVVSTTNYTDASIHLDRPIKLGNGMWLGDNIERYAYRLAPTRGQTEPSFEIDETGHPYWVISLYTHTIGAAGPKVDGVMVVDAATGGARTYAMNEIPAWVDRVQPEWVSELQVKEWGDYVHGWFNFGKIDIVHPTSGMSLVTLKDGRSAWFTGVVNARSQSQNASATNGFMLVDAREGKATFYKAQGVSEEAAQAALEGTVQEKRYRATTPIAYLVHGSLTYVATLKDASGNPRLVGMVSAIDRSVAATGETLDDVTRLYASRLRRASARVTNLGPDAAPQAVGGTLVRSGAFVLDGHGYQYIRLSVDGEDKDFTVDMGVAPLRVVVLARPGDRVDLKVAESTDGVTEVREAKVTPVEAKP